MRICRKITIGIFGGEYLGFVIAITIVFKNGRG